MKYALEKDIPPPATEYGAFCARLPFAEMQPMDSFFIPAGDLDNKGKKTPCITKIYNAFQRWKTRTKADRKARITVRQSANGYRVWRLA